MKLDDYQELTQRTAPAEDKKSNLSNFSLGLCGESGEVADHIKKHVHHGHELKE